MTDIWLFPILDNIKCYEFSKSQQHRLKKFIDNFGFVLYSPTVSQDWYILNDEIELFFHQNSIHLVSHSKKDYQKIQELANLFLLNYQFLRLDDCNP